MSVKQGSATPSAPPLDRGLLVLAGVQMVGSFAALLDATIVTVALDSIAREFRVAESAVAWVSTSYLLTMALVTPLVGWAVDRFGVRRMWFFALGTFLLGSVLCGIAPSAGSLVAFRVVQGLGGGLVLPLNLIILGRAAGPERFGRVMSLVGVPGQLAPILGPVAGGLIVAQSGWRWVFLVNIPLCLLALALSLRTLPRAAERGDAPLDRRGLLLLPPGLVLLVYGFSRIDERATGTGVAVTAGCLAAGAALVGGFVVHARRADAPLIDLRLFSVRTFRASAVMTFLHGIAVYGPLLLLPLYFARVLGMDADTVGRYLAPQGIGSLVGIAVAGSLADRFGARPLVLASTGLTLLGTLPFTQLASGPDPLLLGGSLVVRGFGVGLLGVAIATASYRDVPRDRIARATGTISVVQRVGASFGTAAMALLLALQLSGDAGPAARASGAAYGNTFWWAVALTVVALVPAAMLPRKAPAGPAGDGADAAPAKDGSVDTDPGDGAAAASRTD
ncbi:DHA2 family efflux MFS transporter permease subunit [Streptomyces sp. CSDS2]|uniref:DHA2 family efflux MFS transporter permease subunit n=1 Tax=Streptomyces sp. CSDS2 TaxID=3055051 RepID=UPI0025AF5437|nr:DHA2 family efflux MFS transporter permease subunit [Streptomyces sp. CSDS2]MDN3262851.1 DHA2 family efflux MFS transporter permease subunit [Streptomyces sp. CSDS2]